MFGTLRAAILAIAFYGLVAPPTALLAQDAPKREITRISGDLYRFQNNFHFSVFLVTPDGVIVTDPINKDAALWLEAEIEKRFAKPIKYLVLSHDHADHSSGGEVFADTAQVVAHKHARDAILGEKRPTAVPDITFKHRLTLHLGGKSVELIYPGRSHSDNLIAVFFPEEKVLFAVDMVSVNRLPYKTLSDSYLPDWIRALKKLERIDFEILAPGHGSLGTKADLTAHRRYFEELYDAVLTAARAGQSLDEMKAGITMEAYKDWGQYEAWLPLNIEAFQRQISLHRRGN